MLDLNRKVWNKFDSEVLTSLYHQKSLLMGKAKVLYNQKSLLMGKAKVLFELV